MKILLIDDDNSYRKFLEINLVKFGYEIIDSIDSLNNAISIIRKNKPDIIIIDNNLSGIETGLEFSKNIEKKFNLQIIIMSGIIPEEILHNNFPFTNISFYQKSQQFEGLLVHLNQIVYNMNLKEIYNRENINHKSIIRSSLDAIITIDNIGIVTDFNPAATEIFGYTQEEAIGKQLSTLIIPEKYIQSHNLGFERLLKTGESRILSKRIEIEAIRKDDKIIQTELVIVRDEEELHFTAFIRDITLEKEQKEELQNAFLKIIEQEKMANLGLISAGLAHELNSPLGAILNSAERIDEIDDLSSNIKLNLNLIIKSVNKCKDVVSNLLGSIRETESESYSNVRKAVEDWYEIYKSVLRERNIVFDIKIKSDIAVKIKPISLSQIITNIVMNSVFELQDEEILNKKITVSVLDDEDKVKVHFSDNGKGFPKSILENKIKPFNSNKPKGQGTGLGLWICNELVNEVNGKIDLFNKKGANIFVTLNKFENE